MSSEIDAELVAILRRKLSLPVDKISDKQVMYLANSTVHGSLVKLQVAKTRLLRAIFRSFGYE